MKKAIAILLTALLLLTVFVSCEGDMFGDNITITFNGNGSTGGQMAALKVARGKEVRLTANAYEKTDSEFIGWNTKADGSGDDYEDEEIVSFEEDTTLYAQWSSGVTITFDANDGSGTMDPVKVSADVYELPENGFTAPEGYAFVRWSETADGEVEYEVGDELEVTEDVTLYAIWAQVLSTTPGDWLSGRYTITENTPIDNRFGAYRTLKLYLLDGKTLNAKKGIQVTEKCTLIINKLGTEGTGTLLIDTVEEYNAGIGGGGDGDGGIITINGGIVTANGGDRAAGIGGGWYGDGGTVTITGGIVTAIGGGLDNAGGAGIGGGWDGDGGTVTITGGIVTAIGGSRGAGIGGGEGGSGGKVTIAGGTVTATGNDGGAGIGGGYYGVGGTVTINNGTVTATGVSGGAGIGGGLNGDGGKISISGGTVTANGGIYYAAGIGGGCYGAGGTVTISGGSVTANGGNLAVGIGRGYDCVSDGTLTLTGVSMEVSEDNTSWTDYDGSTRKRYMKTK